MDNIYHYRFAILLFCLVCAVPLLNGQTQFRFEQLSAEQDFTQSIIYQLAQDSFGNIWAATEEGVVRYNAQKAYTYQSNRGLPATFGNRMEVIHIDQQERIWVGAEEGVAQYDAQLDAFVKIAVATPKEEKPNLVKVFQVDQAGQLWIGAYNGLWMYDSHTDELTKIAPLKVVEELYFTEADQLIIGTSEGLYEYRISTSTLRPIASSSEEKSHVFSILSLQDKFLVGTKDNGLFLTDSTFATWHLLPLNLSGIPVKKLLINNRQEIYVGTDGKGILVLDSSGKLLRSFQNDVNQAHTISSDGIYDLLLDQEGVFWVATYGGGLNLLNPDHNRFFHITHEINTDQSIIHPFTRSILEDVNGRIWFGTKNGLSVWDPREQVWQHLLNNKSGNTARANGAIVMSLAEGEQYIWVGTYNDGVFLVNKQSLRISSYAFPSNKEKGKIFAINADPNGDIWLGGINLDVKQIQPDGTITTYPVSHAKTIITAQQGGVWVAGRQGLNRIQAGSLEQISALKPNVTTFQYNTINCLYEQAHGRLLVGTNGAGILLYTPGQENILQINHEDGLPSDIIQGVLPESKDVLWVSTSRGLARVQLTEEAPLIQIFDQSDGLTSTEFNYGSFTRLADGKMLFGGVKGVSMFDPADITIIQHTPKVVLEEFRISNQLQLPEEGVLPGHINALSQLALKHHQNDISIKFVAVSQAAPSKVKYRWMLEGHDTSWSEASTVNQTNFTNLRPGHYTFKVQAANRDGIWGAVRMLQIDVASPWWGSSVAYVIYTLLLGGLIFGLLRLYSFQINKRNAEQQIAFFNNITHELKTPLAILLSSLDDMAQSKPETAQAINDKIRSTITRLTALFEQLLNFHKATSGGSSSRHIVAFAPGVYVKELTASFAPLLKERDLKLTEAYQDAPDLFYYNTEVFDKIIFNLISNAVKYSKTAGTIQLRMSTNAAGRLAIEVKDDGIGIPKDQQKYILKEYYRARNVTNSQLPGTGLGLMMVKSMIENHGGEIRFESTENEGTTFYVSLENRELDYKKANALPVEATLVVEETPDDAKKMAKLQAAKILLVEDNDELREHLAKRLANHFQVITAINGKEGLQRAAEEFPDLIITDLIMPEMNGMEMCQAIQQDINLDHIPVFMLTVLHNSTQKVESIKHGVTEYMEKPINFDLLLAKIARTLSWRSKMRERYSQQVEIDQAVHHRNDREAQFINELEQFVLQEVSNESFSVQDLCKHVGMSRTSLYMKLKNLIDLSPQDFIIHTRLKYARQQLAQDESNIKEVAYRSGFSNPKYFSTSFKKKFGVSPREFRKSLAAN